MSQLSLGIIEAVGLAAAIEVADVCLKSANVNLIGYERTKGAGMTVIKIEGNIGAVKAAVDAALASTNKIAFSRVIARPSQNIEMLIRNEETVGFKIKEEEKEVEVEEKPSEKAEKVEEVEEVKDTSVEEKTDVESDIKKKLVEEQKEKKFTCNICKDPKCTRKKGELTSTCIHYKKSK